MLKKVIQQGRR